MGRQLRVSHLLNANKHLLLFGDIVKKKYIKKEEKVMVISKNAYFLVVTYFDVAKYYIQFWTKIRTLLSYKDTNGKRQIEII